MSCVILKGRNQVHSSEIPFVDFLLIGGGLASATAAETLRAAGAEGSVAIMCAERHGRSLYVRYHPIATKFCAPQRS